MEGAKVMDYTTLKKKSLKKMNIPKSPLIILIIGATPLRSNMKIAKIHAFVASTNHRK
jgi:hypothetical protein